MEINRINAKTLTGPRSYFTDIDPKDRDYDERTTVRKLKLQLLTKEKIVIAASSLFHEIGYNLFSKDSGLISCLESGLIIPAIRNQFPTVTDFFEHKKEGYSIAARDFYSKNVGYSVPWDLQENSEWFKGIFFENLLDKNSLLRTRAGITSDIASEVKRSIEKKIEERGKNSFFQREDITEACKILGKEKQIYINEFANLIYRLSGSRVVNSEPHFPQSNLVKVGISGNDEKTSDEAIFWDIYVETIVTHINSATIISPERLDRLTFDNILKIRKSLFDVDFSTKYDKLIAKAKSKVDIKNPKKIVLTQEEINQSANELMKKFQERIEFELNLKNQTDRTNALLQTASGLSLLATPTIGAVVGIISLCGAIPEITSLFSKSLGEILEYRFQKFKNSINIKIGWSEDHKKSLIEGYKAIVTFGL